MNKGWWWFWLDFSSEFEGFCLVFFGAEDGMPLISLSESYLTKNPCVFWPELVRIWRGSVLSYSDERWETIQKLNLESEFWVKLTTPLTINMEQNNEDLVQMIFLCIHGWFSAVKKIPGCIRMTVLFLNRISNKIFFIYLHPFSKQPWWMKIWDWNPLHPKQQRNHGMCP